MLSPAEAHARSDRLRVGINRTAEAASRSVGFGFYRRMDPSAIDANRSRWVAEAVARTTAAAREATDRTRRALEQFDGEPLTIVTPTLSAASIAQTMEISGPVQFKAAKRAGMSDAQAMAWARTRVSMAARGVVMDAHRSMTLHTVRASGARWRRVTDGKPCAFCAMLASRGPVYAEDTVDFDAHPRCGCTSEAVPYTPDEWIAEYATDAEVAWTNAYFDAAEEATAAGEPRVAPVRKAGREIDTVLGRMRRLHPDMFSDGVHTH